MNRTQRRMKRDARASEEEYKVIKDIELNSLRDASLDPFDKKRIEESFERLKLSIREEKQCRAITRRIKSRAKSKIKENAIS